MHQKPSYEELERANERLTLEAIKYKALFDSLPYGITISDSRGNIVESNAIAEQLLGISKEESERRTLDGPEWRIIRPDGSDLPRHEWPSVIALKEDRLVTNRTMGVFKPDGTIAWLDVTAAPIPGDGAGVVVIYHDVTESKHVAEELSQVFAMSLDMICIGDITTATFLKVNPAFTDILGYSAEGILHKPFFDFLHPEDIESTRLVVEKELLAGAKVINFQNRHRCKDGTYRWLSWVSHPIPERGVTFAVARDITKQKQDQEALEKSKSLLDATGRMAKVRWAAGSWIRPHEPSPGPTRPIASTKSPSTRTLPCSRQSTSSTPTTGRAWNEPSNEPSKTASAMIWNFVSSRERGRTSGHGPSASRTSSTARSRY